LFELDFRHFSHRKPRRAATALDIMRVRKRLTRLGIDELAIVHGLSAHHHGPDPAAEADRDPGHRHQRAGKRMWAGLVTVAGTSSGNAVLLIALGLGWILTHALTWFEIGALRRGRPI
jgi:hypothetical protein